MTNSRLVEFKRLLDEKRHFKMICGAGNENLEEVKRLAFIYTIAGATILDISADLKVVDACIDGINLAEKYLAENNTKLNIRPYVCVSIGMPGDHHVRKAIINSWNCRNCRVCAAVCPTKAIISSKVQYPKVVSNLCIGCGKCSSICPEQNAISYMHNISHTRETLKKCIEAGVENIELHAAIEEDEYILNEINLINEVNPNGYNSVCLDRLNLSNFKLIRRIEQIEKIIPNLIIQADGYPMSGGKNDYNTTLQAIAIGDVINKAFNNSIYMFLSGGTNGYTVKLAKQLEVEYNGISIGSFARKIVYPYIRDNYSYDDADFYEDHDNILRCASEARILILGESEFLWKIEN